MTIFINGKLESIDATTLSVHDLMDRFADGAKRGVAVAVNGSVVPKSQWETFRIENDDKVEIVRATQGG